MESFTSSEITELAKALINVQRNLQPATKDGTNPFTKSHYATLNSVMSVCRDALLDNGIWLCQHPVPVESGHLGLVTKLTHAESGQWQSSLAVVPLPKADPQAVGICMTYLRRYTLSAMLGIVTEEDTDGECGEKAPKSGTRQKRPLTASQTHERHLDDSTQGKDHKNTSESTPEHGHSANLPKLMASPIRQSPHRTEDAALLLPETRRPRKSCSWGQGSSGTLNAKHGGGMPTPYKEDGQCSFNRKFLSAITMTCCLCLPRECKPQPTATPPHSAIAALTSA